MLRSIQPAFDLIERVTAAVSTALIAVAFGTVSLAHAAPLAPTAASQLVTALGVDTECSPGAPSKLVDQQQNADGTTSPFVVPAKSVFVMTSYDFSFSGIGNGAGAFQYVGTPLVLFDATLTHVSYVSTGGVVADSTGRGSGTVLLPSGVPMKAGTRLCFQFPSTVSSGIVFVHGFFAKDK
jgi:hypothetical protein